MVLIRYLLNGSMVLIMDGNAIQRNVSTGSFFSGVMQVYTCASSRIDINMRAARQHQRKR